MSEQKYSRYKYKNLIRIYLDLYKSRGWKLVIAYFLNAHLFDLIHRTNTHQLVPLESMTSTSRNLPNSLMYMVSWTNTLRKSFNQAQKIRDLSNCDFIDLGSGKGKATLFARKRQLIGNSKRYWGIDFEQTLLATARINSLKMFGDEGNFLQEDVVNINWELFGPDLVIYMYNPFNSTVLKQVLRKIESKNVIIIYVNPVEAKTILEFGYESKSIINKWHANLSFEIFSRESIDPRRKK